MCFLSFKLAFSSSTNNYSIARFPELFSAKDEQFHASRRRIVSHIYSMSNVVRSEHSIDLCSRVLLGAMRETAENGAPTNIAVWIRWYSFDIIGELFFSRRFGFLEKREDRNGWIRAVDQLDGLMTLLGVAPPYARRFILRLGICVPSISKAVDALGMFGVAAERCIAERQHSPWNSEDMLAGIIKIMDQKGSQVDFGPVEVKSEIHTALFVSPFSPDPPSPYRSNLTVLTRLGSPGRTRHRQQSRQFCTTY